MVDAATVIRANDARWKAMHIKADRIVALDRTAQRLCAPAAKGRYQAISDAVWRTPDRWWFVAVVHERECGGPPHWDHQLGQGDPLGEVSRNVPAGRGPFLDHPGDAPGHDAFHRAALDALIDCQPKAGGWPHWDTMGGVLTILEEYNGLGYAAYGVPSAYVWSGSDQYVSGKFVEDHVYRAGVIDVQEGCAPLLSRMKAFDASINFAALPSPSKPSAPKPPISPAPKSPTADVTFVQAIVTAIANLFRKKP